MREGGRGGEGKEGACISFFKWSEVIPSNNLVFVLFHCVQILCQAPNGTTLNLDSNSRASVNVSSSSLFLSYASLPS